MIVSPIGEIERPFISSYFLSITKRVRCRMISQKINIKAKAEFNF